MTRSRKWLIGLGVPAIALVALQLFPAERTNPAPGTEIEVSGEVAAILERSCYDCHSNRTHWPWYTRVAPVSWWLVGHVDEGRSHLDFTDWPARDPNRVAHQFAEIYDVISAGEMPLNSYLWLHPGARLTDADRERILAWVAEASPIPVE